MQARKMVTIVTVGLMLTCVSGAWADDFGTFTIDFVPISGDASSANGTNISRFSPGDSGYKTFTDPGINYRMGTYEVTNDQWNKFQAAYGTVTGSPSDAYDASPWYAGTSIPSNATSWYEAAQFVNYLNTSTGHQAAYRFTGTQGTGDYALDTWSAAEADNGTNLYRHKDAFYFMPTEDEWVKAAYWNGSALQTYATTDDSQPVAGVDSNYAGVIGQPWNVGSGSEELNGTYDMMGNVGEWIESPSINEDYGTDSLRPLRGSSYYHPDFSAYVASSYRSETNPRTEYPYFGFRIASVPEPSSLVLLSLGGLALLKRRRWA